MSSAMVAIQEAEVAVKELISNAEKKASDLLALAKQEIQASFASVTEQELTQDNIIAVETEKLAKKNKEEGLKESEAAVFRQKESALGRKEEVVAGLFKSIIAGKI